jgi:hypothetical protein
VLRDHAFERWISPGSDDAQVTPVLPAVHRERRSRDQAGIVGGEEYDRARSPLARRGGTREGITFSIKQAWRKQVRADLALLEVGQEDAVDAARQQPGK